MYKNQLKYDKTWRENNKAHSNYLKGRTSARSFIRNKATLEDIENFRIMLDKREKQLKEANIEAEDKSIND